MTFIADAALRSSIVVPLFWVACSRLRRESEQACDDAVLLLASDLSASV